MSDLPAKEASADFPKVFALLLSKLPFSNGVDFHWCGSDQVGGGRLGVSSGILDSNLESDVVDGLSHVACFGKAFRDLECYSFVDVVF